MKRKLAKFFRTKKMQNNININDIETMMKYCNKNYEIILESITDRPATTLEMEDSDDESNKTYFRITHDKVSVGTSNGEYEHNIMSYDNGRVYRNDLCTCKLVIDGIEEMKPFPIRTLYDRGIKRKDFVANAVKIVQI